MWENSCITGSSRLWFKIHTWLIILRLSLLPVSPFPLFSCSSSLCFPSPTWLQGLPGTAVLYLHYLSLHIVWRNQFALPFTIMRLTSQQVQYIFIHLILKFSVDRIYCYGLCLRSYGIYIFHNTGQRIIKCKNSCQCSSHYDIIWLSYNLHLINY